MRDQTAARIAVDCVERTNHYAVIMQEDDKKFLATRSKESLIEFHHTVGREIRNEHKLWDRKWTPQIEGGCDVSDEHPDAVSMAIIERLWELARADHPL